jgi:aminotransferase
MAIYQTLYDFKEVFGAHLGDEGTHPWSQGSPQTKQIPGGPEIIETLSGINFRDLKYPKAYGMQELREAICNYYRVNSGATIDPENVMVFAGGRPALMAVLLFLR